MTIRTDSENNETLALIDMVDFSGQHGQEIGCGDRRVTWRYADKAAHLTTIEPAAKLIALAWATSLGNFVLFSHIVTRGYLPTS